jgi:2-polyprenyl-3-methyl-5-hydroxy-6-metoxy-1,4-benzoquinol methylase
MALIVDEGAWLMDEAKKQDIENSMGYYTCPRQELLPFLPPTIFHALDVGCGAGVFGESIKQRFGAEVYGLEYVPAAAARARSRIDVVLEGDALEQLDYLPDNYFDFMSCNDVLEHLVEPGLFLKKIKPKLKKDATIVASIPNIRFIHALKSIVWNQDFPSEDSGIFDRTHLRFFTEKSIRRLFDDAGYTVERLVGINPTPSIKFKLLNTLLLGRLADCRWMQFACVARP